MRTCSLRLFLQLFRLALSGVPVFAAAASAAFKSRAALQLENLALRHQLGVLRRSVKRPKLSSADRLLWTWLCAFWSDWRSALVIVKPETVIGWHRKGFQLFWTWKVRHGQPGRPAVSKEIRQLIRKMSRENPLWGLAAHGPNQRAHLLGHAGSPRFTVSDLPVPNRRKPLRCQPITVEALTMKTLDCQSSQTALSQTQSNRSAGVSFGRLTERCRT